MRTVRPLHGENHSQQHRPVGGDIGHADNQRAPRFCASPGGARYKILDDCELPIPPAMFESLHAAQSKYQEPHKRNVGYKCGQGQEGAPQKKQLTSTTSRVQIPLQTACVPPNEVRSNADLTSIAGSKRRSSAERSSFPSSKPSTSINSMSSESSHLSNSSNSSGGTSVAGNTDFSPWTAMSTSQSGQKRVKLQYNHKDTCAASLVSSEPLRAKTSEMSSTTTTTTSLGSKRVWLMQDAGFSTLATAQTSHRNAVGGTTTGGVNATTSSPLVTYSSPVTKTITSPTRVTPHTQNVHANVDTTLGARSAEPKVSLPSNCPYLFDRGPPGVAQRVTM
jgi:hypothetical protein